MKDLNNKVAVITGAGSGIGRALALALAQQGCRLAISDVNDTGLAETVAALKDADVKSYRLDVADRDAIYAHAEAVVKDFGQVNLVINNAGVALSASVREMTDEEKDAARLARRSARGWRTRGGCGSTPTAT